MIYGNAVCEEILKKVSTKMKSASSIEKDTLFASNGNDEIFLVYKSKNKVEHGVRRAKELIAECCDFYQVMDFSIKISMNIGIATFPNDAKSKEDLMRNAGMARENASFFGDNEVGIFNQESGETIFTKNKISMKLKKINFDEEFFLNFQPQISLKDSSEIAFEVLLRWKTKKEELISPGVFIPIAEENGSIIQIGEWVFERALQQLEEWKDRSGKEIRLAINLSAKELGVKDFVPRMKATIEKYSVNFENIEVEITESSQLENNPFSRKVIEEIRNLGISIAIDDFGTRYSTFNYIKDIPADRLKIAKSLVDKIDKDVFEYTLVKTIVDLGKIKGIKVIAEGVERKEQKDCLKEMGCDEIQGYYFSRPLSEKDAYEKWIQIHEEKKEEK